MKLCFSTFASVLIKCQAVCSTQIRLCRALFDCLHTEFKSDYSDSAISDLVRGKKNVSPIDIELIGKCDRKELSRHFSIKVLPLLDGNKKTNIVLALRDIVSTDKEIRNDTSIELINDISKRELISQTAFVFSDFLAGIFVYVLLYTKNTGIPPHESNISTDFVSRYDNDDSISFINTYETDSGKAKMEKVIWKRGVRQINLVVGDLFQCKHINKAILVIPVDTSFSTVVTQNIEKGKCPCVSEQTIHGKWLLEMQNEGLTVTDINQRILSFLRKCKINNTADEVSKDKYPIGTIVIIDNGEYVYFLLAISTFDQNNVAHSSKEEVKRAIDGLLKKYNEVGQGYDLFIPLMGTGRSRVGLTTSSSLEFIKSSLLQHKDLIQGKVSIVVKPEDYQMIWLEEK